MFLLSLLHPVISMLILLRIVTAFFVDIQKNKTAFFVDIQKNKTMFNSKE